MSDIRKIVWLLLVLAGLVSPGVMVRTAAAQVGDKTQPITERRSRVAAREAAAKQLLLLMDTNKSGKISKQEWMNYMEEEFDKLDKNKDGQLDVKELEKSEMRPAPSHVGK
jgi:Ca2+-binding EF-hand superfamily protein